MLRKFLFVAVLAGLFLAAPQRAPAAAVFYGATLKGVTETFDGHKLKFTGAGSMTIDDTAATLAYSFTLSNGRTFSGTGQAVITAKGRILGVISSTPPDTGAAVLEGKATKDRKKITVALTSGIPDALGAPPAGFGLSKMSIKGVRQM